VGGGNSLLGKGGGHGKERRAATFSSMTPDTTTAKDGEEDAGPSGRSGWRRWGGEQLSSLFLRIGAIGMCELLDFSMVGCLTALTASPL
jgi:hypothetical protein